MILLKRGCLFLLLLLTIPVFSAAEIFLKEHMLKNLDYIQEVFSIKYAPLEWKGQHKDWHLEEAIAMAKAKVHSLSKPTTKQFHRIVREFFQSAADYHVSVSFYSYEGAELPFSIRSAEGRYFVVDIDSRYTGCCSFFPLDVGDEILSFNGVEISKAIEQFRKEEFIFGNTEESDKGLAEMSFTHRMGRRGEQVPQGEVKMTIKTKRGSIRDVKVKWDYFKELMPEPGALQIENQNFALLSHPSSETHNEIEKFFKKIMIHPFWLESKIHCDGSHGMGARQSFIPELGTKLWKSSDDCTFYAYIFKSPKGKNIGYVRIASYMGDAEETEEFKKIIEVLKGRTDALVIDQVNNPGGSVFYFYSLLALLTNQPLTVPAQHIALTQEEIRVAIMLLQALDKVYDDQSAKEILGENLGGYRVTYKFVKSMMNYCQFLIKEWREGHMITAPTYLFGVEKIEPHPNTSYTKPILFLTNSLDFSGGDFVPAILQDNHRAMILGTRTAGAGGYIVQARFPNRSGIAQFNFTGSRAIRKGGACLENLGVQPDIELKLTAYDMQNNYEDYKTAILTTLDHILLAK